MTGLRLRRTARTGLVGGHSVDSRLHRHRVHANRRGHRQSDDQSDQHAKNLPEHAGEIPPAYSRFKRNSPEWLRVAAPRSYQCGKNLTGGLYELLGQSKRLTLSVKFAWNPLSCC